MLPKRTVFPLTTMPAPVLIPVVPQQPENKITLPVTLLPFPTLIPIENAEMNIRTESTKAWLVKSGADLPTIQRISGHRTLAMVLRYTHVHGRHIDEAIAAIGRTLPELQLNKSASTTTQELHTGAIQAVKSAS
jgi:hypothetical protein